jgi:hypothetical protein
VSISEKAAKLFGHLGTVEDLLKLFSATNYRIHLSTTSLSGDSHFESMRNKLIKLPNGYQ